jgi:hypothetical protein
MSIKTFNYGKPSAIITGYSDEKFDSMDEAIECAEEMDDDSDLYVFERYGKWVVAW